MIVSEEPLYVNRILVEKGLKSFSEPCALALDAIRRKDLTD